MSGTYLPQRRKASKGDAFFVWFVGNAVTHQARRAGLRGRAMISACVSFVADEPIFRRVFGLDSKWPAPAASTRKE